MTRLILVRHGHVEGLLPERFRGRTEIPLTALGRAQAEATARRIAGEWRVEAIYTSPLGRCVETGQAIAESTRAPAQVAAGLVDFDYGDWAWKTHPEVQALAPNLYRLWFSAPHLVRIPGGDSLQDLVGRAANALREVIERHAAQTVVMVGHDSTNRALLLQLLDQPLSAYWRLDQSPCGVSEIDIENGRVRVRRINETWHLEGVSETMTAGRTGND